MEIKKALRKKTNLNTGKLKQHPDVVRKHGKALAETGFECCAVCPGCPGKTEFVPIPGNEQGMMHMMKCSRAGPVGKLITAEQAERCDGSEPFVHPPSRHHGHHHPHHHHNERVLMMAA